MSATAVITATGRRRGPCRFRRPGPVAKLHSVTKRYGPITALDNFSLELGAGECRAAGSKAQAKPPLCGLLLGLIAPNTGSVRVLGRDPRDAETRTRIGAMLQVARVPEMLRVREHIEPVPQLLSPSAAGSRGPAHREARGQSRIKLFGKLSGGAEAAGAVRACAVRESRSDFPGTSRRWAWILVAPAACGIRCGRFPRRVSDSADHALSRRGGHAGQPHVVSQQGQAAVRRNVGGDQASSLRTENSLRYAARSGVSAGPPLGFRRAAGSRSGPHRGRGSGEGGSRDAVAGRDAAGPRSIVGSAGRCIFWS